MSREISLAHHKRSATGTGKGGQILCDDFEISDSSIATTHVKDKLLDHTGDGLARNDRWIDVRHGLDRKVDQDRIGRLHCLPYGAGNVRPLFYPPGFDTIGVSQLYKVGANDRHFRIIARMEEFLLLAHHPQSAS